MAELVLGDERRLADTRAHREGAQAGTPRRLAGTVAKHAVRRTGHAALDAPGIGRLAMQDAHDLDVGERLGKADLQRPRILAAPRIQSGVIARDEGIVREHREAELIVAPAIDRIGEHAVEEDLLEIEDECVEFVVRGIARKGRIDPISVVKAAWRLVDRDTHVDQRVRRDRFSDREAILRPRVDAPAAAQLEEAAIHRLVARLDSSENLHSKTPPPTSSHGFVSPASVGELRKTAFACCTVASDGRSATSRMMSGSRGPWNQRMVRDEDPRTLVAGIRKVGRLADDDRIAGAHQSNAAQGHGDRCSADPSRSNHMRTPEPSSEAIGGG